MPFRLLFPLILLLLPALAHADPATSHNLVRDVGDAGILPRLQAVLGLVVMIAGCWIFREKKPGQVFPWRVVGTGVVLQLILAALVLKSPQANEFFTWVNDAFVALMNYSNQGARFLFGDLISGTAFIGNLYGSKSTQYVVKPRFSDSTFTPDAMAGEGVR